MFTMPGSHVRSRRMLGGGGAPELVGCEQLSALISARDSYLHVAAPQHRRPIMKLLTPDIQARLLENGCKQAPVRGTKDEIDFQPVVKLFA